MKSPRTPNLGWVATLFAALAVLSASIAARAAADAATPTTLPNPSLPTRTRVMVDANLTPIYLPIYDAKGNVNHMARDTLAHDFLVAHGVEECWVLYNGTFNRNVWWADCTDLADFRLHGMQIPDAVRCDPPTTQACAAINQLVRNPQRFGASARPHCPIFIDVEGSPSLTCFHGYDLAVRKSFLRNWINTIDGLRGPDPSQEISIYADVTFNVVADAHGDDDDAELRGLAEQMTARLSTAGTGMYWWDYHAENRAGRFFYDLVDVDRRVRVQRPQCIGAKTAFVNPCYQIYWPQNDQPADAAALSGKPVPFDLWCREIDWLVAHDYQIVIWMGWSDPQPVRLHLLYAASYGLAYRK